MLSLTTAAGEFCTRMPSRFAFVTLFPVTLVDIDLHRDASTCYGRVMTNPTRIGLAA